MFSILVPTYNQAPYLGAALDSILAQTCSDWEAIVVNDGSTDNTPDVLAAYAEKDPRFRVFHKENGGPGSALNRGLREACGEWICWLSSDDFFDHRKLEIHRDWIEQHPEAKFFFTYFREFNEVTEKLTDPPLWHPVPEREWQVLGMLHHTYVHGNSICISRELWLQAGFFDTDLRYGQDYDMWLRVAALSPAILIPERTCITRINPLQMTHGFRAALFFDCAKAGIKFLNTHSYAEFFPAADLGDSPTARRALLKTIEVASNPYSFCYYLGVHPLLVFRTLEWVFAGNLPEDQAQHLRGLLCERAGEVSRQYPNTMIGFLWQITALAIRLLAANDKNQSQLANWQRTLAPAPIGQAEYWRLNAKGQPQAGELLRYLETFEKKSLSTQPAITQRPREILFVCHPEAEQQSNLTNEITKAAKLLMQAGHRVVVITVGMTGIGMVDDVLMLGAASQDSLAQSLNAGGPLDTVIEIPEARVLRFIRAQRLLIYDPEPGTSTDGGDGHRAPTISEFQGPKRSTPAPVAISDPSDWARVIDAFTPNPHFDITVSTFLRAGMEKIKRKARRMTAT